ncbi:hypothetical protein [Synechococcus sp. CBW1004]|uniref:hypothetical protein n=1 Tax=Synechococcus sp. CBW1004 TaxID=1353136 RepID=UPI0018CF56C8|nr:hypothetical protein [Synechococcus sp. CBW1004]QPN62034.1 hypothetical protein H8F25_09555 [Synechococcus sp. CBW1004]
MTLSFRSRLAIHFAACAAIGSGAAGQPPAQAAVVYYEPNYIIPNTTAGLYINVETQVTGSSQADVPGFDINPYGSGGLQFFNAAGAGIFRLPSALTPSNVPLGTLIDPSGVYGFGTASTSVAVGAWNLNATNYFGFRFVAADGGTKYAWGAFSIGNALNGADRTITALAYEDSGAGISVGDTGSAPAPVPGPLPVLGGAAAFGWSRRLRRRQHASAASTSLSTPCRS